MATTKRSPAVRFKGFEKEWVEKELGQVAGKYYGGGTPSTTVFNYWNGNIPWIQSSDLDEGNLLKISIKKNITELGLKKSATKLIPGNSIAIVTRVGVGKLCVVPFKFTTSQDFFTLSNLNIYIFFGVFAISKTIQKELGAVQGTSIKGITKNELLSKKVNVPSKREQEKIGDYFKELDSLIELHEHRLKKVIDLKQAMSEKLFPKVGADVPEIRFQGFTEKWVRKKVGEYYFFKNGLNKGKEYFGYGTPIVNFTDVFHKRGINSAELKGKVTLESSEIANFNVKLGDIFFTRTSETINEIGYSSVMLDEPQNTVFSGFVLRGRAIENDPLELGFKRYVFSTSEFRKEMVKKSSMTTRALTSGTAIKQMYFCYPKKKEEQKKIGEYFQNMDQMISQSKQKITQLKHLKKALLQKMFI